MSRFDEVADHFVVDPRVKRLSGDECLAELRQAGMQYVPPSYAWAKKVFGNSRIEPFEANFWVGIASIGVPRYSIVNNREILLSNVESFRQSDGTYDFKWDISDQLKEKDVGAINFDKMIPLLSHGEYDMWYVWDLGSISPDGEPRILAFDLGRQYLSFILSDICELYQLAIKMDGGYADYKKDESGRIVLVPYPGSH